MRRGAAALLAILAIFVLPASARARAQSDALGITGQQNNQPVNIEADNGIEWQQNDKVYIARGHAKATRGDDSVTADTLYAFYRDGARGAAAAGAAKLRGTSPKADRNPFDAGSTEVYRIEADGHVVFTTPSQTAYGDHAIYDVDRGLLVVTGKHLKIVTPQDIITARNSFEWYDRRQLGVARGDATAVRRGPELKSIRADVLMVEVTKPPNGPSKISKLDAHGHVVVVSGDQIARGDSGVYDIETGIATLSGNVTLTRGENELRGQYAVVDMKTNVARILSAPPVAGARRAQTRVEGLLIPRQSGEANRAAHAPRSSAPPRSR